MNNINDMIAQANANAQTVTETVTQQPATAVNQDTQPVTQAPAQAVNQTANTALANPSDLPEELQRALQMSAPVKELGTLTKTTIGVSEWLQPDAMGLIIKSANQIVKPFKATMKYAMGADINWVKTVRIEERRPDGTTGYNYVSTADANGDMGTDNRPWKDSVIEAYTKNTNPRQKFPYDSGQVVVTAAEDVVSQSGDVLFPAGTAFGHSTPPTGFNNLVDFENQVKNAGLLNQDITLLVESEIVQVKGRKPWGVLKLTLVQ